MNIKKSKPKKHDTSTHEEGHKDSRQALLDAAKIVFAERGFEGATVKDLADHAKVNVSMVSYYFGGKENLYKSCLESFGKEQLAAAERVLKPATSTEDFRLRLQLFLEEFMGCHLREHEMCKILHRDLHSLHQVALEIFKSSFLPLIFRLQDFFNSARDAKIVRSDIDAEITTGMLFGAAIQMLHMDGIRREVMGKTIADPEYQQLIIKHLVQNLVHGIALEKTQEKK